MLIKQVSNGAGSKPMEDFSCWDLQSRLSSVHHADTRGAPRRSLSLPLCFPVVTRDHDGRAPALESHLLKGLTVTALLHQHHQRRSSSAPPLIIPNPPAPLHLPSPRHLCPRRVAVSLHFPLCWSLIPTTDSYKFIMARSVFAPPPVLLLLGKKRPVFAAAARSEPATFSSC